MTSVHASHFTEPQLPDIFQLCSCLCINPSNRLYVISSACHRLQVDESRHSTLLCHAPFSPYYSCLGMPLFGSQSSWHDFSCLCWEGRAGMRFPIWFLPNLTFYQSLEGGEVLRKRQASVGSSRMPIRIGDTGSF